MEQALKDSKNQELSQTLDAAVKSKIAARICDQDSTASNFVHVLVVDDFERVGRIYFTTYSSDDPDLEEDDCFFYTIVLYKAEELIVCEDGVRLLQELRRVLDQRRTFWQTIGDFHLYQLITFIVTMFFVVAFVVNLVFVLIPGRVLFNGALVGMFLTILGFYFGKEVLGSSLSQVKSRIQSEILATLKMIYPAAAAISYERVFTRFLGVSVYYIEFAAGDDTDFSYAVIEPDGIEMYATAEKVVLNLRSLLQKRQKLTLRFEELGLFEMAAAIVSIVLSTAFLICVSLKLDTPLELTGAMNLVIGYYFAKNSQVTRT